MGRSRGAEERAEFLALDIWGRADGAVITRRMVEEDLADLSGHSAGCTCPHSCDLAARVTVSRVWAVVWGWQASLARTRRLAAR
ncbi:MAG TPA: hypothetical protein VFK56_14485 [Mycobacterium sp.]|nr:hypothetical protein [Mycobacterium sp.]